MLVIVEQISAAAQELIVGRGIAGPVRGQNYAVVALDGQAQHVKGAVDHPVFDGEGVADIGVKRLGMQLAIGLGVHQGVGDANLVAGAVQAALENQAHAEIFAGLLDTGHALGAYFAGGNNLQRIVAGQLGELGGKGLGQAVTEALLPGSSAMGVKGKTANWTGVEDGRSGSIPSARLRLPIDTPQKAQRRRPTRRPEPHPVFLRRGLRRARGTTARVRWSVRSAAHLAQSVQQFLCAGIALRRILRHRLVDQGFQILGRRSD